MTRPKKPGRTKSQAEIRAEAEANRREAHARIVLGRKGDPNSVQQIRTPTGRALFWSKDSQVGRELSEALAHQRRLFVEQFGREPGPDDPLFFDPDADEPTELTPEKLDAFFDDSFEVAVESGIDPAFVRAWRDLGYVVTSENQHLFNAHEVEAWDAAVRRQE